MNMISSPIEMTPGSLALQKVRLLMEAFHEDLQSILSLSQQVQETSDAFQEEQKEIQTVLQGDVNSFSKLIQRHQQAIASRLWKFTNDAASHEEMVHDVFVSAFESLAKFRGEGSFLGWLLTIATRRGYRYWKEKKKRQKFVPILENHAYTTANEWEQLSNEESSKVLRQLLAQLPERDRLVLTLVYWEQCTISEAAQQIGWSVTMTKVQAHRARKKLKRLIVNQAKQIIPNLERGGSRES